MKAREPEPTAFHRSVRDLKNFDENAYVHDFKQIPFQVAYIFSDPDNIYWAWSTMS